VGSIDEIDPRPGNPNGPVVINSFPTPNCMPTSIVQGPGDNFLVGCADHDGEAFPANEYVMNGTTGAIVATITNVGGVDEVWYNPGDNKYYLAARDMLPGPVMGVIDAGTNLWLANLPVNTNAHSIAVDPKTNHVFMPQQAGAICGTQAGAGCIDVIAEQ
jgi:DNA-binding beta-propeller fold protein YncE